MKENWDKAIDSALLWEGGWTGPRIQEPGGYAMRGVSLATFKRWRKKQGKPEPTWEDLRDHPVEETKQIYREMFADKIGFDNLPSGYDLMALHASIMFGTGHGTDDAHPGWLDLNDSAEGDIGLLNAEMMRAKMHRKDVAQFGRGWSDRFVSVYNQAKALQ